MCSLPPFIMEAITRFTMDIVEPRDKSSPPASRITVCPIAAIPRGAALLAMLSRWVGETFPWVAVRNTRITTSKSP